MADKKPEKKRSQTFSALSTALATSADKGQDSPPSPSADIPIPGRSRAREPTDSDSNTLFVGSPASFDRYWRHTSTLPQSSDEGGRQRSRRYTEPAQLTIVDDEAKDEEHVHSLDRPGLLLN